MKCLDFLIVWVIIIVANCHGIFQDLLGLEGYIQHVRDHWIDSRITLPIHIIVILAGLFMIWRYFSKKRKD